MLKQLAFFLLALFAVAIGLYPGIAQERFLKCHVVQDR